MSAEVYRRFYSSENIQFLSRHLNQQSNVVVSWLKRWGSNIDEYLQNAFLRKDESVRSTINNLNTMFIKQHENVSTPALYHAEDAFYNGDNGIRRVINDKPNRSPFGVPIRAGKLHRELRMNKHSSLIDLDKSYDSVGDSFNSQHTEYGNVQYRQQQKNQTSKELFNSHHKNLSAFIRKKCSTCK